MRQSARAAPAAPAESRLAGPQGRLGRHRAARRAAAADAARLLREHVLRGSLRYRCSPRRDVAAAPEARVARVEPGGAQVTLAASFSPAADRAPRVASPPNRRRRCPPPVDPTRIRFSPGAAVELSTPPAEASGRFASDRRHHSSRPWPHADEQGAQRWHRSRRWSRFAHRARQRPALLRDRAPALR